MTKKQSDQIRFPKPPPRFLNRLGLGMAALSSAFLFVARFLDEKMAVAIWGPRIAIPLLVFGLLLALYRKAQILDGENKELILTKGLLGWDLRKKSRSLSEFSRVRLSEDQASINGQAQTVYRLFLEGSSTPALLSVYIDENDAKQRAKAISAFIDLPVAWPQV